MLLDDILILRRDGILNPKWASISPPGRCLYLTMGAMRSPGCDSISTTIDDLSHESGMSERTTSRALRELRDIGLISKIPESPRRMYYIESETMDLNMM